MALRSSQDYECFFVLPKSAAWAAEEVGRASLGGDVELSPRQSREDHAKTEDWGELGEARMFTRLLRRLTASGLEFACYHSIQKDEVYVKVRCPEARLAAQADIRNFALELEEGRLRACLAEGLPAAGIGPIEIGERCDGRPVSRFAPTSHIFGKYDRNDELAPLYARPEGLESPFRSMHRLKLIGDIVGSTRRFGGCGIAVNKRILDGEILAYVPLHDAFERGALYEAWVEAPWYTPPWRLPFTQYKDYFGEQAGLYMVFQAHITTFIVALFLIGLAAEVLVQTADAGGALVAFGHLGFALALCVWSTAMLVTWKKTEDLYALQWGTTDFEEDEPPRPQFKGTVVKSPVDGGEEIFYHPDRRDGQIACGALVTALMVLLVVAFILLMQVFKHQKNFIEVWGTLPATLANACGIQVFALAYKSIAITLTERENWRTETQFRDKLIIRLFVFNCVNAYGSLYFLVFVQDRAGNG